MKFFVIMCILVVVTTSIGITTTVQAGDNRTRSVRVNKISLSMSKSTMESLEQAVYERVNQYRQAQGLAPLSFDETIAVQARIHSQKMANIQTMSHDGFKERVEAIGTTIQYRRAAENVAYNLGYDRPDEEAIRGWIASPGHHQNMIGKYDLTGIGVAQNANGEYYFTQIFIKEK
jgi:uncharacterized protein YkwD